MSLGQSRFNPNAPSQSTLASQNLLEKKFIDSRVHYLYIPFESSPKIWLMEGKMRVDDRIPFLAGRELGFFFGGDISS